MAATLLPDGSVVMRPSGQRPYPATPPSAGRARSPMQAAGGGPGAGGVSYTVNRSTKQPGRRAASLNAYQ